MGSEGSEVKKSTTVDAHDLYEVSFRTRDIGIMMCEGTCKVVQFSDF